MLTYIDEMGDDVLLTTPMDVEHMINTQRSPVTIHCTLRPERLAEKKSKPKSAPAKKVQCTEETHSVSSDKKETAEDRAVFKGLMKNASVKQLGEAFFKKMGRSMRHGMKVDEVSELLRDMMASSTKATNATKLSSKTPKTSPSHIPTSGENIRFLEPGNARGPTVVHIYTPFTDPPPSQAQVQKRDSSASDDGQEVDEKQVDAIVKSAIRGALARMDEAKGKKSSDATRMDAEAARCHTSVYAARRRKLGNEKKSGAIDATSDDGTPIFRPLAPNLLRHLIPEKKTSEDQSVDAIVSQEDKSTATDIKTAASTATSTTITTTRDSASGGDDDEDSWDMFD